MELEDTKPYRLLCPTASPDTLEVFYRALAQESVTRGTLMPDGSFVFEYVGDEQRTNFEHENTF